MSWCRPAGSKTRGENLKGTMSSSFTDCTPFMDQGCAERNSLALNILFSRIQSNEFFGCRGNRLEIEL